MFRELQRCTEQDEKKCKAKNGPIWKKVCQTCEKKHGSKSNYVRHLLFFVEITEGGVPLEKNDLPFFLWLDLCEARSAVKSLRRHYEKQYR